MNKYISAFLTGFCIILCFLLQVKTAEAQTKTTTSISAGAWGTSGNWSNGVPDSDDIVIINHLMDFTNVNLNIGANAVYTFNIGASGSAIPLALSMNSGTPGPILNIYTVVSFAGGINLNGGTINVYNGAILTVTNQINQAGTLINIESTALFNVVGNYLNNGGNIAVDGLLAITGNYNGQNAAAVVTGSGDITTVGSMVGINNSSIFGIVNPNCGGPNCSGRRLCGTTASCTPASSSLCSSSSTPIILIGSVASGSPTAYQWQSSATNTEAGFTNIGGATNSTYSALPSATTYYRVKITINSCVSLTPVAIITYSLCSRVWDGSEGTSWTAANNWTPNTVPTLAEDVLIPNVTNKPIITSAVSAKSVVIEASSSLTINSGSLSVYGNLTNSGTLTTSANTTIAFNGSSAQTISGVANVHDLTINNSAGVALFSPITVKGTLTLTSGVLSSNSYLTIDFTSGGNIASAGSGSITGNVTGLRTNVSSRSHYIAAPFSGVSSGQVNATIPIWISPYWQMHTRNFTNQNWVAVTNTTTPMTLGTGFSLAIRNGPATLSLTGSYNHSFTFTSPSYSNTTAGKYILIGNPYPSTLDWDNGSGWTKTGISGAIYYWDAATGMTKSYNAGVGTNGGTKYIPAMQAFMVATSGGDSPANSSVYINNGARISNQNPSFMRISTDEIVRITLQAENSDVSDDAVIRFNESATSEFDSELDAYKIINASSLPSVYTTLGETNYSINSLASLDAVTSIPVYTKIPSDGNYTLTIGSDNPALECILIDKKLGTENLISGPDYKFSAAKLDDPDRFELKLRASITTSTGSSNGASALQILSSTNGFVIQSQAYAGSVSDIEIFDITGKRIQIKEEVALLNSTFIPLNAAEGAYLVKVNIDNVIFVQLVSLVK